MTQSHFQSPQLPVVMFSNNMSDLVLKAIRRIHRDGVSRGSRNGESVSINRAEMVLLNPKDRYLNIPGRVSNIFQMMAETIWVMAGDDRVDPLLSFFLPRAADFSDDGKTWRGAYGPRLYEFQQLNDIVETFKTDGLDTRRAVLSIYMPHRDAQESLTTVYGIEKTKDLPCNNFINFWVDADNMFNMDVIQRSGDIIWGAGSINLYEFSFLMECVFELVKQHFPEIKLGSYCHRTTNLHYYPAKVGTQVENILRDTSSLGVFDTARKEIQGGIQFPVNMSVDEMRELFCRVLEIHTLQVEGKLGPAPAISDLKHIFGAYEGLHTNDNTLFVVSVLVSLQIAGKMGSSHSLAPAEIRNLCSKHPQLLEAVEASTFRKFDI